MRDILAVEREEAAHVWQAQEAGLPVEHRDDVSPLAVLGIRLVTLPAQPFEGNVARAWLSHHRRLKTARGFPASRAAGQARGVPCFASVLTRPQRREPHYPAVP